MKSAKPEDCHARPLPNLGGIIHTYQKYDPLKFPTSSPPPDLVTPAFEHLLAYGDLHEFTPEELANAVKLDVRQIAGLGPSLESLKRKLQERKEKILATYETRKVVREARQQYQKKAEEIQPPKPLASAFERAVKDEQLHELERLWYRADDERGTFAKSLLQLVQRLGDKYQIDELAAKYSFTGSQTMSIPEALEIKEELETIDRLLKQLEEAQKTGKLAIIDLEEMSQFASEEEMADLGRLQQQVEEMLRQLAEQQGIERSSQGYHLTPQAYRIFQGKLLEQIFSELEASRSGRHQNIVLGEGAVELQSTKEYEFGDSVAHMDIPQTMINALLRSGPAIPMRLQSQDIVIHRTRNHPKCATAVLMDMSGSMRYGGQYVNVKRMALALQGLITKEYPGDFVQFIEMYSVAKPCSPGELVKLLPKPVTIFDPVVRLRADMSRADISESDLPPHFTNIQHALQLARQSLGPRDTPNKQIILITDGLPTAHFEGPLLYFLYPSDPLTEAATMREALLCRNAGIVINIFLLQSWSQSREDIRFAHRVAETTKGRVFFTAGRDLSRYVVWDYVKRRKSIIGGS